jgi:ergothioneine biosynthesis protein EgtB
MEEDLAARFRRVRGLSRDLAAPLSDADATIQPHPDASPAKWHLAHTTWFFETFVLRDHVPGYRAFDERWAYLFNSYYEAEGERHARPRRGMLSRPSLDEVRDYRRAIDDALASALPGLEPGVLELVELGLHHEQQHQELLLMDLLAAMAENPLKPAVWQPPPRWAGEVPEEAPWWALFPGGLVEVGASGAGFAFDNEGPTHRHFLPPFRLADRTTCNAEWLQFMADGGYANPLLWLSDGWAWVQENGIRAPLYWEQRDGAWFRFGLDGLAPVNPAEPVCHVNYYEADAFARWAGARLPTEQEWEHAASSHDPAQGIFLDTTGAVRPKPVPEPPHGTVWLFGNVWEWTASAYLPYPGFKTAAGAVGEYNGKFMSGQMVLRGGSCATPRGHVRGSYRNFFYPHQRWMFAGLRLARDA